MTTNKLVITTNGNYKNIDLSQMGDGDVVEVTKKYDEVKRFTKTSKFNTDQTYVLASGTATYKETDVGFFMPKGYNSKGVYVDSEKYGDLYDAVGKAGDSILITCKKGIVNVKSKKSPNGKDEVFQEYTFTLAE